MKFSQMYDTILPILRLKRGLIKMSVEKVNLYKEQKANRKKILEKERKQKMLTKIGAAAVVLALLGWFGYSAYDIATKPDTSTVTVDSSAIDEYLGTLEAE